MFYATTLLKSVDTASNVLYLLLYFNDCDFVTCILLGLSTKVKKSTGPAGTHERPSSQYATIWMGSESGVYVVNIIK